MPGLKEDNHKKRKLDDVPEIEIDVSAPEPPSKKALRKAKKKAIDVESAPPHANQAESTETTTTPITHSISEAKSQSSKQRSEFSIWIGNLPFTSTKDDLRKFFVTNCSFSDSSITRIHLPMGFSKQNGTPQSKGFAYVDFSTRRTMDEAIGLSEQLLLGRRVLIKGAKSFEGRPEEHLQAGASKLSNASSHPPSRRIFVGNLGFDVTKEAVEEHFSPCGTVENVHLTTFEDSGKCKGYGWVEFATVEAAESAVKGFVKVKEDEDDEDEQSGSDAENKPAKSQKPKTKKVWVNRLLGRQLRMEFAEDAATRYKKRFGKERAGKGKARDGDQNDDSAERQRERRPQTAKQPRPKNPRYTIETVARLTGAIIEGHGNKTTFD